MPPTRHPGRSLLLLLSSCLAFVTRLVADGSSGARLEAIRRRIYRLADLLSRVRF